MGEWVVRVWFREPLSKILSDCSDSTCELCKYCVVYIISPRLVKIKMRIHIKDLIQKKQTGQKIVAISLAHAGFARIADSYADILLVGDSLAMTLYGFEDTLQADMPMMLSHTQAVRRVTTKAFIIADMPIGSYQESPEQAYANSLKLIQAGAQAVKLEGGLKLQETIEFLVARAIPVMSHVGLKPQFVRSYGGYKVQGGSEEALKTLIQDAKSLEQAGAFGTLIEGVYRDNADELVASLGNLSIGIGASQSCDGQILVAEDILGLSEFTPKFVKRYANLQADVAQAFQNYAEEIGSGYFPEEANLYSIAGKPQSKKLT